MMMMIQASECYPYIPLHELFLCPSTFILSLATALALAWFGKLRKKAVVKGHPLSDRSGNISKLYLGFTCVLGVFCFDWYFYAYQSI